MAYISLELAKIHLIAVDSYQGDDEYISNILIPAAEDAVAREICEDLKDLELAPGILPGALQQAILLTIGDFYANRETITFGNPKNIKSLEKLKALFRNYSR